MLPAEEEGVPSLLSRVAPILREEFNLERKWRISSDPKQGLFCDLFQLCPGRRDQRGPSHCPRERSSPYPLLLSSAPQPVRAGCGATRRTGNGFPLRTRRAPGHPSHDTGANCNIPGGSRFTFYTDPWEVRPGNQLTLLKLELLSDSKFFTISTRGPQYPIRERKDEPGKRETEAPFPPKTNFKGLIIA